VRSTTKLRQLLAEGAQVVAPGIYDPLSAKAVVSLGFNGVYLGGFATSAALGTMEPLMSMTEQVEQARLVADAIGDVPLIVDGHTGYGDPVHITRAVRECELAGIAAIHIEDQPYPKKVSYHKGADHFAPVSVGEMQDRIKAACNARTDDDFVIVARTDARGAAGGSIDEVIDRLGAYREAGADVLMPQVYGRDEARIVHEAFPDIPLFWFGGVGRFGGADEVPLDVLHELGYQIAAYSIIGLCRAINTVVELYSELKTTGLVNVDDLDEQYERVMQLVDAPFFYAMEEESNTQAGAV
jgi:2-methylisocitrate lyase-like PEP mutase family enzyme